MKRAHLALEQPEMDILNSLLWLKPKQTNKQQQLCPCDRYFKLVKYT